MVYLDFKSKFESIDEMSIGDCEGMTNEEDDEWKAKMMVLGLRWVTRR